MEQREFLPNRLNFDAVVFCGCSMKEMQVIAITSLVICMVVLGFLTKLLLGMMLIGIGLAFPACVGLAWFMAITFQKLKHGKPKGYVKQRTYLWLDSNGFLKSPYIKRTGKWSIGRWI